MKNVLITGASGFLGKYVLNAYSFEQYNVTVLGRTKVSNLPFIQSDLSSLIKLEENKLDEVIHIAGKAHSIPRNDVEASLFFTINFIGTQNLIKSLENQKETLKSFIYISTIAVYGLEEGENIDESYPVNPKTPYGQSKLQAEKLIETWCKENGIKYFIIRLPLIVGKNPLGNLGQMINAIKKGYYVQIKGNNAKKSVVLAEDIAQLLPKLHRYQQGIYNLSDRTHPSFSMIENEIENCLSKKIKIKLPISIIAIFSRIGDLGEKISIASPITSLKLKKITASLTINDDKAYNYLNWRPRPVLNHLSYIIKQTE